MVRQVERVLFLSVDEREVVGRVEKVQLGRLRDRQVVRHVVEEVLDDQE